jgi:hypothetical protein
MPDPPESPLDVVLSILDNCSSCQERIVTLPRID